MSNIIIFENSEFGKVRTTDIDGNVYFVGKDVAEILGYSNPSKAVLSHVDEDDKQFIMIDIADAQNGNVPIGQSKTAVINESGLYALILSSKLPTAKKFKRWVTNEVLPSIRKNGGYIAGQETLSDDELMAKALMVAQNKIAEKQAIIEQQQKKIETDKPKTIFADAVSASKSSILVGDLAKLICQNGYQIGQKRLFDWLRENGYLIKSGSSKNMPMQRYIEQGLFEVKESNIQNPDGSVRITRTTKVTGKGQIYFINKFLNVA